MLDRSTTNIHSFIYIIGLYHMANPLPAPSHRRPLPSEMRLPLPQD